MMRKTRLPDVGEIQELAAFLPKLYAEGFEPIKRWGGGKQVEDGVFTMPWPEYDEVVAEFIRAASKDCWCDYGYHRQETGRMLEDKSFVKTSTLVQIKTMLTYCVRGERFCDGHWAAMIESGHIRRLLERLAELGAQMSNTSAS